jgi:hypothetical protein
MWGDFERHWRMDVPFPGGADEFESPAKSFSRGVLLDLTNQTFVASLSEHEAVWWCEAQRFDCRHAYLHLAKRLFWFGHKIPKFWMDPKFGLQPTPNQPAKCDAPVQHFEPFLRGAECCSQDRGGRVIGSHRDSSRLLHYTDSGYAASARGCEDLCVRMNCTLFSWTSEWHRCIFCDGSQCPFAARKYRTRWSNYSSVWKRIE